MSDNQRNYQQILVVPVATAVLLVWMAAAVYSFLSDQYAPLTITTPVMLVLAGYVFGFRSISKALEPRNGNGGK